MKECPICATALFDDMEVCYGCLYRFGSEPAMEEAAQRDAAQRAVVGREVDDLREWVVRLEVRNRSNPDQLWSVELAPPGVPAPVGRG